MSDDQTWDEPSWDEDEDEDLGPLVRPYTVTRGRTRTGQAELQVITLVMLPRPLEQLGTAGLDYEHVQILRLCSSPVSIVEISSHLHLPLSVVKILVADLIDRELLIFRSAVTPDVRVLQAVINGIRRL